MFRYIVLISRAERGGPLAAIPEVAARLRSLTNWQNVLSNSEISVWCSRSREDSNRWYLLPDGRGVLLGTLFTGLDVTGASVPLSIGDKDTALLRSSQGRHALERFWGRFVAILQGSAAGEVRVLKEPCGDIRCFHNKYRGVHVYFSDVEDCVSLGIINLPDIDWGYIALHLLMPTLNGEVTPLKGTRELCGGQCDHISNDGLVTHTYWHPRDVARDTLDDQNVAASKLQEITKSCIHIWASRHAAICTLLSGGIDSSIVVGCLRDAPTRPRLLTFTQFAEGPGGGDERVFARLAASPAASQHVERPVEIPKSMRILETVALSMRPTSCLPSFNEREIMCVAAEHRVDAIYTGAGGDALFFENRINTAVDHLLRRGFTPRLLNAAVDSARLCGKSLWTILRTACTEFLFPQVPDLLEQCRKYYTLLPRETVETAGRQLERCKNPWLRELDDLPPGKREHLQMVSLPFITDRTFRQPGDPEEIGVLMYRPVLEHVLRIPIDILTAGGRPRGLARRAFANDVPAPILAREDKGSTVGYTVACLNTHRKVICEVLADGVLVSQGLLDRQRVIDGLRQGPSQVSPFEILSHLSMEVWLSRWKTQGLCRTPEQRLDPTAVGN